MSSLPNTKQDLLDYDYISLSLVGFQVVPSIPFFVSNFKGATILFYHNELVILGTLNETACLESAHQTGFESAVSCFQLKTGQASGEATSLFKVGDVS